MISNEDKLYVKIVGLNEALNFVVDKFFIWDWLVVQIITISECMYVGLYIMNVWVYVNVKQYVLRLRSFNHLKK